MTEESTENKKTQAPAVSGDVAAPKEAFALVHGKYKVYPNLPLPALDMPNAKAYQAEDTEIPGHLVFALICNPDLPIRKDHLKIRDGLKTDGLLPLADYDIALWAPIARKTMILIYEMPLGGRVVQKKPYGKILPDEETDIITLWIKPLLLGINNLTVRGLTHRSIRPENLFYMDVEKTKVVLGDCICVPPGYDQDPAFETIEASMCSPEGKGNGSISDDLYALGVTLLCLGLGRNPVDHLAAEELLEMKIYKGSYATLIGEERIRLSMIELFRGLLADNVNQRWDMPTVILWADGRRLTPVQGKTVSSQRPFTFNNVEYFSYRPLAYAFSKHWELAAGTIRSDRFKVWIERSFEDKKVTEAIQRSIDIAMMNFSSREKQDDFIVARTCMLLDPTAPLRVKTLAFVPEALGTMLAMHIHDKEKVKLLMSLVATGYVESWYEFRKDLVAAQEIKTMQISLQKQGFGQGVERLLYALNDGLPCQSPLILKDYVVEAPDLLPALDAIAKKVNLKTMPIDAHIAAFMAVRYPKAIEHILLLNSQKENTVILGILYIFAAMQKAFGPDHLYSLAGWVGSMVSPIIESYHNQEKREQLEKALPKIIKRGNFSEICALLDDKQERLQDISYFEQAKKEYMKLSEEIEALDGDREKRDAEGLRIGNQVAAVISFGIVFLTMAVLLVTQLLKGV